MLEQNDKRVEQFVRNMHDAKLETERRMRRKLEFKILQMQPKKLISALGRDFAKKVQNYIKRLHRAYEQYDVPSEPPKSLTEYQNSVKEVRKQ